MKKLKKLSFILSLIALAFSGVVVGGSLGYADVQLDQGQSKDTAPKVFFVGRYGRTGAIATAGAFKISKDMVVLWDVTSADGVSVQTTTTAGEGLVAGIAMEDIAGSSRDNTAAQDLSYGNWGRIQTWGLNSAALKTGPSWTAGDALCTSTTAGQLTPCNSAVSNDSVGVALVGASAATTGSLMVYR